MQVDPIEPTLKAPGSERLKLRCDDMLSSFALEFSLRRFNLVLGWGRGQLGPDLLIFVLGKASPNMPEFP